MNRGKPNWEHLSEDLHVLITVEDAQNRATLRLNKAADEVRKLLVPLVGIMLPYVLRTLHTTHVCSQREKISDEKNKNYEPKITRKYH